MARMRTSSTSTAQPARPMPEFRLRNRAQAMERSRGNITKNSLQLGSGKLSVDQNRRRRLLAEPAFDSEADQQLEVDEVIAQEVPTVLDRDHAVVKARYSSIFHQGRLRAARKPFQKRGAASRSSAIRSILESGSRMLRSEEAREVMLVTGNAKEMSTANIIIHMLLQKARENHCKFEGIDSIEPPSHLWWEQAKQRHPKQVDNASTIASLLWAGDEVSLRSLLETESVLLPTSVVVYLVKKAGLTENIELVGQLVDFMSSPSRMEASRSQPELQIAYQSLLQLLCVTCVKIDARLLLKTAGLFMQHLDRLGEADRHRKQIYRDRRDFFNYALRVLGSRPDSQNMGSKYRPVQGSYVWAAQKALLTHSARYDPPLQLSRRGFVAIREVLASLPKDSNEKHTALQHAATWPPYLEASDGIDERAKPEENWSRVVQAGGLMQEAGYAKSQADLALDVLQGTAPDGSPTIQQRKSGRAPDDVWAAAIRATRNAKEAWVEFQKPRALGRKPTIFQYHEMFRKLGLRDHDQDEESLPGDKPLNYAVREQANLSEIEKARLQPPTIIELYEEMMADGRGLGQHIMNRQEMAAASGVLVILLSNSTTMEQAHQYLEDAGPLNIGYRLLVSGKVPELPADAASLRGIGYAVMLHYVEVCASERNGLRAGGLTRLVKLLDAYGEVRQSPNHSLLWAPLLREIGQSHKSLGMSPKEQLATLVQILDRLGGLECKELAVFNQFNKCLKKIARRELPKLLSDMETVDSLDDLPRRDSVESLYSVKTSVSLRDSPEEDDLPDEESNHSLASSFRRMGSITKQLFHRLAEREAKDQLIVHHSSTYDSPEASLDLQVSEMDRMQGRRDPVRADHASNYMLALAYTGEFQEMANFLQWLMKQWSEPSLLEEMSHLSDPPAWADFYEVLCIYRLLAEPMLVKDETDVIKEGLCDYDLPWRWPDEDGLRLCVEGVLHESVHGLRKVIQKLQARQDQQTW